MKRILIICSGLFLFLFLFLLFPFMGEQETSKTYAYHLPADTILTNKQLTTEAFMNLYPQEPITIIFAGDTMFDWSVKTTVQQHGPDYPFKDVKSQVSKADYALLNLETAVTHEKEKDTIQLYNFKSDPVALKGIKNAGFDAVTLANNHALDYQSDGFLDTMDHLETHKLDYFGAGKDKTAAYRAHEITIKGRTIKFLGFSRFLPAVRWYEGDGPIIASAYQQDRVLKSIEQEAVDTDYLLVYMHWGVEGNQQPEAWQRDYARRMVDAGADAIIGAHPHVLQGFEYYNNKPIAYSLGNFLFPDYVSGTKADTGLLQLTLDGKLMSMEFTPYQIRADKINSLEETKANHILQRLETLSYDVVIEGGEIKAKTN